MPHGLVGHPAGDGHVPDGAAGIIVPPNSEGDGGNVPPRSGEGTSSAPPVKLAPAAAPGGTTAVAPALAPIGTGGAEPVTVFATPPIAFGAMLAGTTGPVVIGATGTTIVTTAGGVLAAGSAVPRGGTALAPGTVPLGAMPARFASSAAARSGVAAGGSNDDAGSSDVAAIGGTSGSPPSCIGPPASVPGPLSEVDGPVRAARRGARLVDAPALASRSGVIALAAGGRGSVGDGSEADDERVGDAVAVDPAGSAASVEGPCVAASGGATSAAGPCGAGRPPTFSAERGGASACCAWSLPAPVADEVSRDAASGFAPVATSGAPALPASAAVGGAAGTAGAGELPGVTFVVSTRP